MLVGELPDCSLSNISFKAG